MNLRSLLIGFTLINADNDGTKELRPAYKPSSFFQRMRVMAGSVIAEIPDLNRYEAMMDILQDDGSRNYTDNLGFGETFYNEGNRLLTYTQLATNPGSNTVQNVIDPAKPDNFGGFKNKKTVYYWPSCPFFNVSNFIPLSYCPIVIELTLVSDATEPLVNQSGEFTVANTSFLWNIEQPFITCDVHRLDDGLFAEYAEILEKQSLPITFNSVSVQTQTTSRSTDIFTTIVRNVSKADNIFISFYSNVGYSIRAVSKKCWNLIIFFITPFRGKAEHQLLKDIMQILIYPFSWVLAIPSYPKCQRWGSLTTTSIYKKHETITVQSNLICIGRIPF